ncbi:MAG: hypothetical protein RBU37_26080 [Myxococcota bacterium]|jgi:hypothetical protein|nr:hypothetical protein [Myxococcota bacterium]
MSKILVLSVLPIAFWMMFGCDDEAVEDPNPPVDQDAEDTPGDTIDVQDQSELSDTAELPDSTELSDTADVEPDETPSCGRTELLDADVLDLLLVDALAPNAKRSFRVGVLHMQECYEQLAMPLVEVDEASKTVHLRPRVWTREMDCLGASRQVTRMLTLQLGQVGEWTLRAGEKTLAVMVEAPIERACETAEPGPCDFDCDCPSPMRCLSTLGLAGPFKACAEPCETSFDCMRGACISMDDGFDLTCQVQPGCRPEEPCPEGWLCEDGNCVADFQLNGSLRKPCYCDSDCEGPLTCIYPREDAVQGNCELRCSTSLPHHAMASERYCSPLHICMASDAANGSICEWLGE